MGRARRCSLCRRPGIDPTPDERNAVWAADRIRRFAKEKNHQPFFLGVGFIRPHMPLHVSRKYFDMFPLDQVELPLIKPGDADDTYYKDHFESKVKGLRYYRTLLESFNNDELALKTFTRAYLACVAAVDECIGQVVNAVDNSPFKDNTIIIVTSDHGWQMGQKEYLFKNSPWEESCRVPLIIRAPGISKPGGVVEHPVSLIDLYPTLVDLCGLQGDTRKNQYGAPLDGHSLRPFLEDPINGQWDGPAGALSMIWVGDSKRKFSKAERQRLETQHWSYRTRRWRYIRYNDGAEELYDHESDPHEWTNLAARPEYAEIKRRLAREMKAMIGPIKKIPAATVRENKTRLNKGKWDWFTALDANKDKVVTEAEWLAWSKKAQAKKGKTYHESAAKKSFASRDADGDGKITRVELEAGQNK